MTKGTDLVALAETRIGEKYDNVMVPKNNPNWHGPWDCAEFATWLVYQTVGKLYGCVDNKGNPATVEAYSGAWVRDCESGILIGTDQATANITPGVILVRTPPLPEKMGHVAISDGYGGTIEAAGRNLGVRKLKIEGRLWHFFAKIQEVSYSETDALIKPKTLPYLLQLTEPNIKGPLVRKIQKALKERDFNPGVIDGEYGPNTLAAVYAFQKSNKLVADGIVGPATAKNSILNGLKDKPPGLWVGVSLLFINN